MATKELVRTGDGLPIDWRAVLWADKDAAGAHIRWDVKWLADVILCELVKLDCTATTHQGKFSLHLDGQHRGATFSQFRLHAILPAGRTIALCRLCRCKAHAEEDHPVHWHRFEHVPGESPDPPESVLWDGGHPGRSGGGRVVPPGPTIADGVVRCDRCTGNDAPPMVSPTGPVTATHPVGRAGAAVVVASGLVVVVVGAEVVVFAFGSDVVVVARVVVEPSVSAGALNGAVIPEPLSSGSAGQPWSAHAFAARATSSGSVTRTASPSTTTSASRTDTAIEQRGSLATLWPLRVPAPVRNQNAPSSQRAPTAVTWGLPSWLIVESQVGAGVVGVQCRRRPCVERLEDGRPVNEREPVRCTQVGPVHRGSPFLRPTTSHKWCRRQPGRARQTHRAAQAVNASWLASDPRQ